MKNCRLIIVSLVLILFLISGILFSTVIAETMSPPLYFGITELRTLSTPNLGYAIGDPNTNGVTGSAAKIWNIVKYSNSNFADPTEVNVYCVKAGVGFSDTKKTAEYDLKFDMVKDKEQIAAQNSELNGLVNNGHYNELLALADLLYLPGQSEPSERTTLLNNAGIYDEAYDFDITDDEIKAIQQAAIWYFTNYGEENNKYDKYNNTAWLWYTENGSTYKNLSDYNPTGTVPNASAGHQRQEQAELLYKYLIDTAKANSSNLNHKSKLTLYASSKNNQEQPLMDIERIPQEFDLALRKYITKVNGKNVTNTRNPSIDKTTLHNGTTATYKHRKDPILVKNGDIVTYNLTIYNEGDIEGRATKIIDQLPTGLVYSKINTTGYTANYDKATNKITITKTENNNLAPYTGENIASETIEIECTVEANNETKILTNVAWISEEVDANGTIITNQKGADRDSEPTTAPNVNKDNMSEYKGNNSNKSELEDPNYFYKGEQDDDDFEKLRIEQITGNYQIQLEKVDKDDPSIKLAGAEFEVTLPGKEPTKKVTGENGILDLGTVKIEDVTTKDTIQVKETKAPEGYNKILDTMTIEVEKQNSNGKYTLKNATIKTGQVEGTSVKVEGNTIKIVVGNKKQDGNYQIQLEKVDKDDPSIKLAGAEFEVTLPGKEPTKKVTGENGILDLGTVKIEDVTTKDTIQVKETKAPEGYNKILDTMTIEVEKQNSNGKYTLKNATIKTGQVEGTSVKVEGNTIKIVVGNKKQDGNYQIQLEKVDKDDPSIKLAGAEFEVTLPGKEPTKKVTGENGILDLGTVKIEDVTTKDTIQVKETKAPEGYNKILDTMTIEVEKQNSNGKYTLKNATIKTGQVEGTSVKVEGNTIKIKVGNEKIKNFDLSLRKFITNVNDKKYDRVPKVDVTNLKDKTDTTSVYNHPKKELYVAKNDIIIYTIRVYNEGQLDGYVEEVTDFLPEELEFLTDNAINKKYEWVLGKDGRTITTDYLSKAKENSERKNLIKAFDGEKLDYKDLQVACKVKNTAETNKKLTNIAAITKDADANGKEVDDIDSDPSKITIPSDEKLPSYKDEEINKEYVPGQEDDDDFEKVIVQEFDLALRKFITNIDGKDVTTRIPEVSYDKEKDKITYNHPKDPMDVVTGDIVTYTIRVYNEGDIDGYAQLVSDDIPDGLKFLPENETNVKYRWVMYDKEGKETENVEEAEKITTDYLSKEQEEKEGENLLKAFNKNEEISETNPDHRDIEVAFEVVEPNGSDKVIINSAQISEDSDKEGNPVEDKDSTPDKWVEGEDDQDKEYIKLRYFDLALRKWVTEAIVIEDGKQTVTQTGHTPDMDPEPVVKVELYRKDINKVTVKFRYSIRVTNEGDIAGYVKEITDYVPEGLKFVAEDNLYWKDEGNNIISTTKLENTLLQPGESADVEVLLTWINNEDNMGLKTNIAEISKDYNDKGVPDRDSTPDNKKPGEDDIDDAPVILSIETGKAVTYVGLGLVVLVTIAGGVFLIKKYVM